MRTIHNEAHRRALLERIETLRSDSSRVWGKMSVDQMLHHVNAALEMTLGRLATNPKKIGMPLPLFKLLAFNLPWPKGGAPTAPELIAPDKYDFEAERSKLRQLIGEMSGKPVDGLWVHHPAFGPLTGRECTKLQYKHIDHHLRQFGV